MRTLALILNVRKNSSRCPNKLLRNFAGTTLIKIAIKKAELLSCDEKYLCANEKEFENIKRSSVGFIKRSKESATIDGPLTKVFEAVQQTSSDFFMFFNPCCAHVQVETLQSAIDVFKNENFMSMTSVEKIQEWIYRGNGIPLIVPGIDGDTKLSPLSFRVAHVFHIIPKKRFFATELIWTNRLNDPYLFEIPKKECIDIDDELDFSISELLYEKAYL